MVLRPALAATALALLVPGVADAAQAPGRVVLTEGGGPVRNVDASGAGPSVALPDGGVVVTGDTGADPRAPVLTRLRADGSPDPGFGLAGRATVAVPDGFRLGELLRRPDGRLLLVGSVPGPAPFGGGGPAAVVGLTAEGARDPSFGDGGVARLVLQTPLGGDGTAALQADGALLVAGVSGTIPPSRPGSVTVDGSGLRWQVARLTAGGRPDPAFGDGGTATVTTGASGYGVGVAPTGRILTLGVGGSAGPRVAALTPAGAPDAGFHGGTPLELPVPDAFRLGVDPAGRALGVATDRIVRVTPDGTLDAGFGAGGVAASGPGTPGGGGAHVLPQPDGGLLVGRPVNYGPVAAGTPAYRLTRLTPSGATASTTEVRTGFGGGIAAGFRTPGAAQDGFFPRRLHRRPGGGFLLTGGVRVVAYTGEGEGSSSGLPATVGLTPGLRVDPGYGGPATRPAFRLAVPAQRAATAADRRTVVLRITGSAPGLALLRVRDGRRRILAQSEVAVFAAGSSTVRARVTPAGRRAFAAGRSVRVTVGHAFRDVLAGTANGERVARLR